MNIYKNILVLLLPLLLIYISVCAFTIKPGFGFGDEGRYVADVKNLLSQQPLTLEQAPGYPLFLTLPRMAGLSWYWLKWFNPFFLYLSIVFVAKSMRQLNFETKHIVVSAYLLGFYIPFWNELAYLYTEPLALMLISLSMYFCVCFAKSDKKRHFIAAAILLGYLALVKALIGYVAAAVCIAGLFTALLHKSQESVKIGKLAIIFGFSLVFCLPYLIYTYRLTGEVFYWANTGGENVYWLTNPNKGEYGFWNSNKRVFEDDNLASHRDFIGNLPTEDRVRCNKIFMSSAIENIKKYPAKCFYNWLCNLGRMFFNYPYDYKYQNSSTLLYTIPNSLIFWLNISMFLMLYYCRRCHFPGVIIILLLFVWIYWFGQSCSTAGPRKMYLAIPVFTVCYAYVLRRFRDVYLSNVQNPKA
jgi:hypothetical protein